MRSSPRLLALLVPALSAPALANDAIVVDHTCTNLPAVPAQWIDAARSSLHIAYGHTSHGSQVTEGMTGLVSFTGGCGGPQFDWNHGGTGGALDLHDYAMAGDVGYYPQWENETRSYLDNPANADVNVIIWSWCGQVSGYTEQDMIDKYLAPMTQLELDYPDVTFVYMTGHLNHWSMANTNARNQQIRDYCLANGKVLYDFAHIESYDPDGTWFEFAHDNCDYYDASGALQGNWAIEWQNAHVQGVDWYNCYAAHSQPLNGNQKAYAAWWLWARIAGWGGETEVGTAYCQSGTNGSTIHAYGSESVAANALILTAVDAPLNEFGLFYYGNAQIQFPFGQGFRCVGGSNGICRLMPVVNSGSMGVLSYPVDLTAPPRPEGLILAGSTWNFQAWFRDGTLFDLSNGVSIVFAP